MNLDEYERSYLLRSPLLLAIALYPTQQNWKCLRIRNRQYTEFHISIFGIVGPFEENLDFLVRWDLTSKQILIAKPKKSSSNQLEL